MPLYPYICQDCQKRFQVTLSYAEYDAVQVNCAHCQSGNVRRRIGRVRVARSEDSRMESLSDPAMLSGIDDDPRAMAKLMRKMSSEMGDQAEGTVGAEFDEVVDRLESGQTPEQIEKDLPDLAGDSGSAFDGFD
ncbi:MAG: zinc ribbon domain-containing protein [Anaerolineae bacterium]|nr:zinc ribbon domain-containing protein [Anaerolineae bacterium]